MGLLDWLREEISGVLSSQGDHGILVWYDPGGTLGELVQGTVPEGVSFIRFAGSYLAPRYELEERAPDLVGRWVLYIPEFPPKESWLRDLETLGRRWELDLLEILHRKYGIPLTPMLQRLLRHYPENAKLLARAWKVAAPDRLEREEDVVKNLFGLVFGLSSWNPVEALIQFLAQSGWRERLELRGLWEEWARWVASYAGWRDIPQDEAELRSRLAAAALLSEFAGFVPALESAVDFVPREQDLRQRLAELARIWRDRSAFQDSYEQAALEVERRYSVASRVSLTEDLVRAETFRFVDELWRRELQAAVGPDSLGLMERAARVREVAKARGSLFWSRRSPELRQVWSSIELAARLLEEARQAVQESEKLGSVAEFIQRYTGPDGWWRLDLWALELAAGEEALDPKERDRFVLPAWQAYRDFLDTANTRFVEAVSREGWQPEQPAFWRQVVLQNRKRTAVFLVDGLRYDLARRIAGLLGESFRATVDARRGILPGVTELAMAGLLPDADRGLEPVWQADRIRVRIEGHDVGSRSERRAWLEKHLGRKGKVVDLEEVDTSGVEGIERLVVLSGELDKYGTFAVDLHPRGLLELVGRIARSIRLLADRGFERFVLVADHGFLYVPPGMSPRVLSAGTARITRPRFAVGVRAEGCWTPTASELGLQSSEIFSFPLGFAVFPLPGSMPRFLHGGVSLQESLVPILTVQAIEQPQKKVEVSLEAPDPITSRIAVIRVRAIRLDLLATSRRVRVRVGERESETAEVGGDSEHMEVNLQVPWLDILALPPSTITISLLDADTGEVLDRKDVRVELVV